MKYITFKTETGTDLPFLFPDCVSHKKFAEALATTFGLRPIAAGFMRLDHVQPKAVGGSMSLELTSRPEDANLVWVHNIVSVANNVSYGPPAKTG